MTIVNLLYKLSSEWILLLLRKSGSIKNNGYLHDLIANLLFYFFTKEGGLKDKLRVAVKTVVYCLVGVQ